MKLEKHIEVEGVITALTGLKIGGTAETVGIGETDNPIIRHPITRAPYIPGSSLKGKLRSLLEMKYSPRVQQTGNPCDCSECSICALFGSGVQRRGRDVEEKLAQLGPSRLVFRDAMLTDESAKELDEALPGSFVEVKTEIAMNRNTGSAKRGALRQQERIPEGMQFDFVLTIRLFEEDMKTGKAKEFLNLVAEGIDILEKDYLGGCGTRGYGQVEFSTADEKPLSEYIRSISVS